MTLLQVVLLVLKLQNWPTITNALKKQKTDDDMEFANAGAGIGGGFEKTMELKPIKYKEAIHGPDGEAWGKEIENKHDQTVKNDAWE
jgi:hypothetical protein